MCHGTNTDAAQRTGAVQHLELDSQPPVTAIEEGVRLRVPECRLAPEHLQVRRRMHKLPEGFEHGRRRCTVVCSEQPHAVSSGTFRGEALITMPARHSATPVKVRTVDGELDQWKLSQRTDGHRELSVRNIAYDACSRVAGCHPRVRCGRRHALTGHMATYPQWRAM